MDVGSSPATGATSPKLAIDTNLRIRACNFILPTSPTCFLNLVTGTRLSKDRPSRMAGVPCVPMRVRTHHRGSDCGLPLAEPNSDERPDRFFGNAGTAGVDTRGAGRYRRNRALPLRQHIRK